MSSQAPTAKARIMELLSQQPDDSSYDDLLRELALARMVERGLADSDAGRTIPHADMKRTMESWRR